MSDRKVRTEHRSPYLAGCRQDQVIYRCSRCGRVIEPEDLEYIGRELAHRRHGLSCGPVQAERNE